MYTFYESVRSKKFGRTSTNMYLQYKWDTENFANHRYKVKTAKPSIDNSAPLTFTHMFVRPKKLQLELERYSMIQRNNRFLLERLATIQREGAWIDDKNYRQPRSLNTWKRQQEMIHLAHNNQIMIARLQDVNAQHNRTKLEDEYLINQKYKANIQKWPPNWRELQKHLHRVKDDIFKKVFDSKYQTEAYQKSRKRALRKWALETERHAAEKAKKVEQETIEAEKRKETAKEERKKASRERKKALEELLKSSDKWRSARDKRLDLIEEKEKSQLEEAEQKKQEIQEKEIERRHKQKEKVEKWRKEKEEEQEKERLKKEEQEKLEKQKKAAENLKNQIKRERKRRALEEARSKKEDTRLKAKDKSIKQSSVAGTETTGPEEITITIDPITKKSVTDKTLSKEQIPELVQEMLDQIAPEQEDQAIDESISGQENLAGEHISSDEETPIEEQIPNQEDHIDEISDGETATSEQTNHEDHFTTDENISEEETRKTDPAASDEESS